MNNSKICPDCNSALSLTGICSTCGYSVPPDITAPPADIITAPPAAQTETAPPSANNKPVLNILKMKAWYTASEHIAFPLRIDNLPAEVKTVTATCSGHLAENNKELLFRKDGAAYHAHFQGTIPDRGGDIVLDIAITCEATGGEKKYYSGQFIIDAIAANTNQADMIKKRIQTRIVNITNKDGIVDLEGFESSAFDEINIHTQAGLTALENTLEQGSKILSEVVTLFLTKTESSLTVDRGIIRFLSTHTVKHTHLIARNEAKLGRATIEDHPDIALKCFPETEENQNYDRRMSRHQCQIRYYKHHFQIKDASTWGTYLNGERLNNEWGTKIANNDIIQMADLDPADATFNGRLRLRATVLKHALLLERINNAPEEENYLIIAPETKPSDHADLKAPIIYHHHGRFYYDTETGDTQPLLSGVTVTLGELQFSFEAI